MREALSDSGFSPGIMNNDNIPLGLVNDVRQPENQGCFISL